MERLIKQRTGALWRTKIENPSHHEVIVTPNYPARPEVDAGHLLLIVRQRTTLAGRSMRLGRSVLADLWRWLLPQGGVREDVLVRATVAGGHADVLLASPGEGGMVGLLLTHRADDYPDAVSAALSAEQALELGGVLQRWLFGDNPR